MSALAKATVARPAEFAASDDDALYLLGTRLDMFSSADEVIGRVIDTPSDYHCHLCYVNAHSLNLAYKSPDYREALHSADLVLNDGIGVQLGARMQGKSFPENLNGSDFTLRVLEIAARQGWRVFLYGGVAGVAEAARANLTAQIAGLDVVGVCDGYSFDDEREVIARVRASEADLLIVALGQPKQELWLHTNLERTGCRLGLGVGAFLDFQSGRMPRAPRWMNAAGIEWVYRLAQEPGRMWRRYVVGNPTFLWRAWRSRHATARP